MSHLRKIALKTGVVALVLWGGYNWLNRTPERADAAVIKSEAFVDKTLETSDIWLDKSGQWADDKAGLISESWDRLDIGGKVDNLQDKTLPIGNKIKAVTNPKNIPGMDAAHWADKNMSFPAMLMMLVTVGVLALMALASPSSLSGGRH